jgi:3-phenylpropionate/trans-cinnamate dioxygenase ferredoxin reductase subunit
MRRYKYLIVGGGMAADAAVRGIRERDGSGQVGIITAELHPPYARPPLSKALWKGEAFESVWRGTEALGVDLHLGRRAQALDVPGHCVTDDAGGTYGYDQLLLATGVRPRRLPFGGEDIIYFRTLDDYTRLKSLAQREARVVVIGAGFIGTEIAAALTGAGARVTLIFPEEAIGSRVFAPDLAAFLSRTYQERGVEVLARESIETLERRGKTLVLRTRSGRSLQADAVVAGIGVEPNVELAQGAGLATDNGIVVDEQLRTTGADVFAAGDVANVPSPVLGKRVRVEHEDAALGMGKHAGRLMAGADESYDHVPFFYSDLFDLGYEAVGELDARLDVFADWKEPFREGVVYYLRAGLVRGVLLWNVWGQVDAARDLLASANPVRPADLQGRIAA